MRGEDSSWKKEAGPISNYFSAVNRNKKSVTLDLKCPEGKDIFRRLADKADILLVDDLITILSCQPALEK